MTYRHGGSPHFDLARFGLVKRPVTDFSVSLNPLGPPGIIREKWPDLFDAVKNYPSPHGAGVVRYYEEKFGLSPDSIIPGNGSTELIYLIPRAIGLKKTAILAPCFYDYEQAALLAGAKICRQTLSSADNFALPSPDNLIALLDKVDSLWIGRPNNPTGIFFGKTLLTELAVRFPDKWFIVDEAFIQFLDNHRSETFLTRNLRPNILVIHSLTKFYALAGLRLGAGVGHSETIARLKHFREPWSINAIADQCAPLLLDLYEYENKTLAMLRDEQSRFFKALSGIDGVRVFGGSASFILCQWMRTPDLDDLLFYLLKNGVYVRDCRNFPGLESNFFRIGLRKPDENMRLAALLGSYPEGRA